MIIGISGKLGSGKDTLCSLLIVELATSQGITAIRRSWADALKEESASQVDASQTPQDLQNFLEQNGCTYADKIITEIYYRANPHDETRNEVPRAPGTFDQILAEMHDWECKWRYRSLNQWWGTEYRRVQFGQNYWVDQLLKSAEDDDITIIPDTRFPNEAAACDKLIRIERDSLDLSLPAYQHPSETLLDGYRFDYIVPNVGTVADLKEHAQKLVELLC